MIKKILLKSRLLFALFIFFLFSVPCLAQLNPFALQVTAVNESCTANGVLNFTVSNTTAGATILYRIYQLPNITTPIAVTALNTFTGLIAGNYRVIATQSLGSESNTQQQDATINASIVNLSYTVSGQKEICGNDGSISISATGGNPVSYEIFSGPMIRPLQSSNVFNNLTGGNYLVRVFDNCGEGVVANFTLGSTLAGLTISNYSGTVLDACNLMRGGVGISNLPGHVIAYPLTMQLTLYVGSGPPIVITETDQQGSEVVNGVTFTVPVVPAGYTFQMIVTDGCGNTYTQTGPVNEPLPINVSAQANMVGCDGMNLHLSWNYEIGAVTLNFISAPPGFNPTVYNSQYPGPYVNNTAMFFNSSVPLPNGTYVIKVTDSCGRTATTTVEVFYSDYHLTVNTLTGCGPNYGSVQIIGYALPPAVVTATILSAPTSFAHPLPYDASEFIIDSAYWMSMNSLPVGDYVFSLQDGCGRTSVTTVTIEGYASAPPAVTITPNCSSFTLFFTHEDNNDGGYLLQKYYPAINAWGNPNFESAVGGVSVYENYQNVLSYTGQFRIVKSITQFSNATTPPQVCREAIYTFEYTNQPQIIDVYSFACSANMLDVVVVASGLGPLTYKITMKNGQPFIINNGTSPIFLGLEAAIYNFQMQDICGNILNSLYDISQPVAFTITPQNICAGQNGSLSVPNFSFLEYQWWQGNNTTVILSTSNSLQFPNFNPVTQGGTYHVRIKYPNPNSCIDVTLDYQMPTNSNLPNAGTGQTISYCGNQGAIDLFSLLSGNYDPIGAWHETTSSGALANNIWDSANVNPGNYQFNYTVTGSCGASDQSTLNIQIKPLPETPVAFIEQTVCDNNPLQLLASTIPFGSYQWSGPNGFSSTEQNPIISSVSANSNGIYTVKAISDGCESGESSVQIAAEPLPLVTIESGCVNSQYTISARLMDTGINTESVLYSWTGPGNFSSNQNPVVITNREKGLYTVTVTSEQGCTAIASTEVDRTFCTVPTGISPNNDQFNDNLDLTGFDVSKLKVFSRYGNIVYEQNDYIDQWHGQDFDGRELPDATYYYYIRLNSGEEMTGWVYVTR